MGSPGDKLDTGVVETSMSFLLRRSSQRSKDAIAPVMKQNGLSALEFTTLCLIQSNGACILRTLADAIGTEPPAMNRIMNSLEEKQLVRRQKDSEDRRFTYFRLTDAGVELVEKTTPEVQQAEDNVLSALPDADRQQLFSALQKLI